MILESTEAKRFVWNMRGMTSFIWFSFAYSTILSRYATDGKKSQNVGDTENDVSSQGGRSKRREEKVESQQGVDLSSSQLILLTLNRFYGIKVN
jgi:hypothetical protein